MIEAYPLQWPASKPRTPITKRKAAQFGTKGKHPQHSYQTRKQITLSQAVDRVLAELIAYNKPGQTFRVNKSSIVISTNVKLKRDGLPMSGQRQPDDSGGAVYFTLDGQDYCLPCDKWDRVEDNVAAVAAHIGALRGIERWGVGQTADAYAGYTALPEQAVAAIWPTLGLTKPPATVEELKEAYKQRAKLLHPNSPGGSHEAFTQLGNAYEMALKMF